MHRTRNTLSLFAATALAAGLVAAPAAAAPLLDVNFDTTAASSSYAYRYPDSVVYTAAVKGGVGVGGTNGLTITNDSTAASSVGYWGMAFVIESVTTGPIGVTDLSELLYSIDIEAIGFAPGKTSTPVRIDVRFHDGSTLLDVRHNRTYDFTAGGFQTFDGSLADGTVRNGSLAALLASTKPITVRVTAEFNSAAGGFGYDAGNVGTVDNIAVGTLPEPAALSLLGTAGLLLITRHRGG